MAARVLILAIALTLAAFHRQSVQESKSAQTSVSARSSEQAMEKKLASRDGYVGDETCGSCHGDKVKTFSRTAHHLTSRQGGGDSIAGTFGSEANVLKTSNPALIFRMDREGERFFQKAIWGIQPFTTTRTESIDLVIGSGRKGQTYLFWKGDRLFQLPVSYWIDLGRWVNSPGYRDGVANFNRPVIPRCLECHASYAETLPGPQPNNRYKKTSVVLGISCERCHGPGREHVDRHQSGIADASGEAIVNPAKLQRDRNVEVCAQCHAGHGKPVGVPYSYTPGQQLDAFLTRDQPDASAKIDVHGNQVALLQRSRCYQSSAKMTCDTCHNVHDSQRDAAAFSPRCLACHQMENCGMYPKIGAKISSNCIDCHMPVQQSNAIISDSNGKQVSAQVRNHWIKVYPETAITLSGGSSGGRRVNVQSGI
jgi:hypothetical protein